ncbi:MAG: tetratricopeptide repeat protein, partial [Candidatus Hodarchaeota archaeon]
RESIYEFRKAIDLRPSSSDYHFHLGINYGSLDYPHFFYWKIIQNSFERTMMLDPTDVRHLYFIGMYYLNEYQKLKHMGWSIEKKGPANKENYLAISKDNYQLYFRKLVDVNEEYLGKILNACFSVTQDYVDLRSLIGDTARSHFTFARFLDGKGMWEEAEREYREAINLEPANPIYYSRFAHALSRRRYYEDAIYWWQKQKLIDPGDGKPYLFSADSFIKLKRFDDAVRELRELIKLDPENINYHIRLVKTLLDARRLDEAIDEYRKVMGKTKSFSESLYEKIRQYQRKGDYPKAVRMLNEALASAVNR